MTPYAEVIGDPIAQSKSPQIHGFWLRQLGLNAQYRAHHVTAQQLSAYISQRRSDPAWLGCNVTMPHKQAVIPLIDRVDPAAAAIGAVNTLVREADGMLTGYNTDVGGFMEPLRRYLEREHLYRMARIVGTGGAARAAVAGLAKAGFTIVLAGRNPDKARAILNELAPKGEHHTPPLGHFAEPTEFAFDDREGLFDVVVNASPLGMRGQDPLQFDFSHVPPGAVIYDIVTDPVDTEFVKRARSDGFETISGLAMLIGQAAEAFTLFFGQPPPRSQDADLMEMLEK